MAVACDDGVTRIFGVEGAQPGLAYVRSLPGLGSRVLSVAWHPDGASLLLGTAAGTLHAWHLTSGRELLRINVGARPLACMHLSVSSSTSLARAAGPCCHGLTIAVNIVWL